MTLPEEDLPVKRCTHCGEEKPLDAFPRDRASPDGRFRWCKTCNNAASREYYARKKATPDVVKPAKWIVDRPPLRDLREGDALPAIRDREPPASGGATAPVLLDAVPGDGPAARARSGRGRLMALPVRREDGRWFVRGLWGYPTEAAARAAAKELWRRGSVVRVEARGGRWDVWWGI